MNTTDSDIHGIRTAAAGAGQIHPTAGIIAAMDSEMKSLASAMISRREEKIYGLIFYSGMLSGQPVVLVKCGIGKVNAARCAQILIDRYAPKAIINTGIAGGILPGLHIGDVVVASGLLQHDFDVSAFGHAKGYLCTGENDQEPTVFHSDERLSDALSEAVAALLGKERLRRGIIATGYQFISSSDKKAVIHELFGAAAAEMEGCAIAQTAFLCGVPFAVVRTISDLADGTASESYASFEEAAAKVSAEMVIQALKHTS